MTSIAFRGSRSGCHAVGLILGVRGKRGHDLRQMSVLVGKLAGEGEVATFSGPYEARRLRESSSRSR
jgi:hypothetical protein